MHTHETERLRPPSRSHSHTCMHTLLPSALVLLYSHSRGCVSPEHAACVWTCTTSRTRVHARRHIPQLNSMTGTWISPCASFTTLLSVSTINIRQALVTHTATATLSLTHNIHTRKGNGLQLNQLLREHGQQLTIQPAWPSASPWAASHSWPGPAAVVCVWVRACVRACEPLVPRQRHCIVLVHKP
jgi:hypothetical protein